MQQQRRPAIDRAIGFIDREVKQGDGFGKVIAVKVTKDHIFLDVEKEVDGGWCHYEVDYEEFLLLQK